MSDKKKDKLAELIAEALSSAIILAIIIFVPGISGFLIGILEILSVSSSHLLETLIGLSIGIVLCTLGNYVIWKFAEKMNKRRAGKDLGRRQSRMKPKYVIDDEFEVKIFNKATGEAVYEGKATMSDTTLENMTLEIKSELNDQDINIH